VGVTRASPEQIMTRARALLESAYGPVQCLRRDIQNGRCNYTLITPRYALAKRGRNYKWLEVSILFNPDDGLSIVEVDEVERLTHLAMWSLHGGIWLFPPAFLEPHRGAGEHGILVAILQGTDDASAYVTIWPLAP
jgi:hypothetical protein